MASEPQEVAVVGGHGVKPESNVVGPLRTLSSDREASPRDSERIGQNMAKNQEDHILGRLTKVTQSAGWVAR